MIKREPLDKRTLDDLLYHKRFEDVGQTLSNVLFQRFVSPNQWMILIPTVLFQWLAND